MDNLRQEEYEGQTEFREFLTNTLTEVGIEAEYDKMDIETLSAFFRKAIILRSPESLYEYVCKGYKANEVELSSAFFDVNVEMPEKDIIETFARCQKEINGDDCVCIKDGIEQEELIPEGEYQDIYKGNCQRYLDAFDDKRFHRFIDEEEEVDFVY